MKVQNIRKITSNNIVKTEMAYNKEVDLSCGAEPNITKNISGACETYITLIKFKSIKMLTNIINLKFILPP